VSRLRAVEGFRNRPSFYSVPKTGITLFRRGCKKEWYYREGKKNTMKTIFNFAVGFAICLIIALIITAVAAIQSGNSCMIAVCIMGAFWILGLLAVLIMAYISSSEDGWD